MVDILAFDEMANTIASIQDIDYFMLRNFMDATGRHMGPQGIIGALEELDLLAGPPVMDYVRNAALLFFSTEPERFLPYSQVEIVDKPVPDGSVMTESIIKGPLHIQLETALMYFKRNIVKEHAGKSANFPYEAIKEALVNALCHKSYAAREPVVLTLTPDALEIKSIPGPPQDATIKRNRLVAAFFKELGYSLGRGTGIPRIISAMEANGSPPPVFESDAGRCHFSVILPIHESFQADACRYDMHS